MALKRLITKDEHAKLSDALKGEYKAEGDGANFVLDLTDYEDPVALKRAKDHEKTQRQAAEKAAKEAADALALITKERDDMLAGSIPKADADKLRLSYDKKIADLTESHTKAIGARDGQLQTLLVDNVAIGLASKISNSPKVILPHIKARLKVEQTADGQFVTRVLDGTGAPSAFTVDDLEKEILANKEFAPILTGSKGSGGGAGGAGGGGGASKKLDFAKATPKEIAAHIRDNPQA